MYQIQPHVTSCRGTWIHYLYVASLLSKVRIGGFYNWHVKEQREKQKECVVDIKLTNGVGMSHLDDWRQVAHMYWLLSHGWGWIFSHMA